ncbi:transmembrane protease serine 5-like [Latimeria chalumnae]|uniref:transmembrane protease serine 5-like n=1 Tax=Latimeria chalumnae TaxID=7897 RepID=UPI00313A8B83
MWPLEWELIGSPGSFEMKQRLHEDSQDILGPVKFKMDAASAKGKMKGSSEFTPEAQSKFQKTLGFLCTIGLLAGTAVGMWLLECGIRSKTARIIGGSDAMLGRWPWQVSLYHNSKHMCGGTIITHQWIITAAHCVYNYRLPEVSHWLVYAGMVTRSFVEPDHIGYPVETIIYNQNYDDRSHDYDIALMKLKSPLNFTDIIRPVCLPGINQEFPGGTQCWISGWGYTRPDNFHIPDTLKEASVPLISTKKCNSSCMYDGEITPRMLCAGYPEGKTDACQGDSGGPLVCEDGNVWHLVGVVSWGTGCAEPNHPGVYTKVVELLHWIYEIIEVKDYTLRTAVPSWKRSNVTHAPCPMLVK